MNYLLDHLRTFVDISMSADKPKKGIDYNYIKLKEYYICIYIYIYKAIP